MIPAEDAPKKARAATRRMGLAANDQAFDELVKSINTHGACQCDTDHLRPAAAVIRDIAAPKGDSI